MTRRQDQIADLLQREIAELLTREVKHPLLRDTMLSITQVEVTGDLGRARVHISVLDDRPAANDPAANDLVASGEADGGAAAVEPIDVDAVLDALRRSSGFMHRTLVKRLHLRRVPRLEFVVDRSIVEADRLSTIMRDVAGAEGRDPFAEDHAR